jgi:Protein of unknown function (DUF998)
MLRLRLLAGLVGPVLFTVVTLVEGLTRPGYNPLVQLISELALTQRGWVESANFVVSGTLLVVFSGGLRRMIKGGRAATWGPRWVAIAGTALAAAGVFVIDPSPIYPPGAVPTRSWHGLLHQVAGPGMFLGLTLTAFVYARRVARPYGMTVGVLIIALFFVGTNAMVTLSYAGAWPSAPAGLLESASAYLGLGWIATLAVHLLRQLPVAQDPRPASASP